jgi:sec-independent protein translocase protein TatC
MKLRPIGQEERLSIIDHLDELRTRLIISASVFVVALCVCFWQNHALITVLNRALPASAKTGLGDQSNVNSDIGRTFGTVGLEMSTLSRYLHESKGVAPGAAQITNKISRDLLAASKRIPKELSKQEKPIAIGVGEAFTTTVAVAAYFALMVTLPLLLYQLYAFVIPALSRNERKVAIPTMIAAPFLFLAGATFTYFAVLPPAVHFLQGYNSSEYQNLVQAKSYYTFEILLLMGIGLAFQVPLLALGLQKVGIISANTLTLNWRYATVLIAVIVAALPGVDPVTMTMETLPLVGLYVLSIVLLKWVEHRNFRRARAEAARAAKPGDPAKPGDAAGDSGAS